MNYVDGQNREQLFVTSLDQLVHPESFVRIIDAFVDSLDFSQFNFSNTELNAEGRPPFHPEVLLKLYLYGLHYGIRFVANSIVQFR